MEYYSETGILCVGTNVSLALGFPSALGRSQSNMSQEVVISGMPLDGGIQREVGPATHLQIHA